VNIVSYYIWRSYLEFQQNYIERHINISIISNKDYSSHFLYTLHFLIQYTGLFISPSGISELDCATTKTDMAERSILIGSESLQVFFFVLGALAYFQVPPLGGSHEEKWRSQ